MPLIAGILMVPIGLDLLGFAPKVAQKITAGLFPRAISDRLIGHQLKGKNAPFILFWYL